MQKSKKPASQQEKYSHGYASASDFFATRQAESYAAFFIPHLKPGMRLLDVGCGPGSLTVGLAQKVAPGQVEGVDISDGEIEKAKAHVAKVGAANVRFSVASAYELPFPDESFDAVFSHTVLEHLKEPVKAIKEMRRVLVKGGVLGVRNGYEAGHVRIPPRDTLVEKGQELINRRMRHNGGDPDFGPEQPRVLREAGFDKIYTSASYSPLNPEYMRANANRAAGRFTSPEFSSVVIEQGWADMPLLRKIEQAILAWRKSPDLNVFHSYCEAVTWK